MQELSAGRRSDEPIYNIGAVVRMVGIPEATLRAWERRYGFPMPARTGGSHRLYSEGQVRQLQWIRSQIDSGMQVRQAVQALHRLDDRLPELSLAGHRREQAEPSLAALRAQLMAALLARDVEQADQVLGDGLALHPLEELILAVIRPVLAEIGDAWSNGQASVATEHFTTHYLRHRLLMWMLSGPIPHSTRPIVLACAPGEWHEGSLLILGTLLRRRRWPVAYLGQSVPLPDLVSFVEEMRPPAVVLVAMTEEPALALADWPRWFPEATHSGRPLIGYGGRIFVEQPQWRDRVPGRYLGDTLEEGVEALDRWMRDTALGLAVG
jgi:DNA-binding transcriptional MerR regulator